MKHKKSIEIVNIFSSTYNLLFTSLLASNTFTATFTLSVDIKNFGCDKQVWGSSICCPESVSFPMNVKL